MEVNVQADSSSTPQSVDLGDQSRVLRGVTGCEALVGLCAGAGRGAAGLGPAVGPVAVVVSADARLAAARLAVLAPQTVVGLSVQEAVWVDNGHDVEVKLVDERTDRCVGRVLGQKVPGHVLGGLQLIKRWAG